MELEMAIPSQKDINLIDFYTPKGSEDEYWKSSLLMMRDFVNHLQENVTDTKKQAMLQLTNLSIADPDSGVGARIRAWNGQYTISYSVKLSGDNYKEIIVGKADNVDEAVRLMYVAFERSVSGGSRAGVVLRPLRTPR